LGIALCLSVLVSVAAFVFILQSDMNRTRDEILNTASVTATVGESHLKQLFTQFVAVASLRKDEQNSSAMFLNLLETTELLPMSTMICEQRGSRLDKLYEAVDQANETNCTSDDYKPITVDMTHLSEHAQVELLISEDKAANKTVSVQRLHEQISASIILRVALDERHSLLFVLDSLALLSVFFPVLPNHGILSGEYCLFLSVHETFEPIACKDTSIKTPEMAAFLPESTLPKSSELLNLTVHGLKWQVFSRPNAIDISKNLTAMPFIVLGGTVIFCGLICWFVFHAVDKTVRLNDQNDRLARLLVQLEQQNKDLDQFAIMAAHDLQAPLRFIVTRAHFLDQDVQELQRPDLQEHSGTIIQQGMRMQALILDLLTFCRAGQDEFKLETVDIPQLIREQIDDIMKRDHCRQAQIAVGNLPDTLISDREKLAQVISHLLDNAVKFSQKNAHVSISARYAADSRTWDFMVDDNGCGIDVAQQNNIFRPFTRLDPATEGTGIGLAIVKKLIERLQGRIWVDSDFSGGTRFCFTLPILKKEAKV